MATRSVDRPILIYDGDCGFCRLWIARWKTVTGDLVQYAPFQEVSGRFPQIPLERFKKSVQLVTPGGEVFSGANAVFRTLAYAPGEGWMLWMYRRVPGAAWASEATYRQVAAHRRLFSWLTRLAWGARLEPPSFRAARWLFLRLLGVIYLIAFLSFSTQMMGLIGSRGILPAARFLEAVKENFGTERYWIFPTLAWFDSSDGFLKALGAGGVLCSLLVILGIATVPALILLWVFYSSLVTVGQDFMTFQWDALLLEAGFLAIFFAPWQVRPSLSRERKPSRAILWLLRLLLFRLTFSSGASKLLSGDPTWRNLTALEYHYETQPLPTPIAWYAQQLPAGFQKFSVVMMFVIEILVPFLIFFPRRLRSLGAGAMILLQLLIALTGNYTFFNLLTIGLCVLLYDDAALEAISPRALRERYLKSQSRRGEPRAKRVVAAVLALILVFAGAAELPGIRLEARLPVSGVKFLNRLRALRIVNRYGLFSVMTTARPEIVIEGSRDGQTWLAYEFPDNPGDVTRRPTWVEPFQSRLDWQMWFAALGGLRESPWFSNLMLRLLQGSPPTLALLAKNPFPDAPPRYIRALVYEYHFTDFSTRLATGAWWRRRLLGVYFPEASLE